MARAIRFAILMAALPLFAVSAADAANVKHAHISKKHTVYVAGIGVMVDQARLVSFTRPAKTVAVGDPVIADVNIVDARHALVLGKTFGVTNLIALDENGVQIENKEITVVNHQAAITINRGVDQYNYSCMGHHCEVTPRPGDANGQPFFDNTEKAIGTHEDASAKAAQPPVGQTPTVPMD